MKLSLPRLLCLCVAVLVSAASAAFAQTVTATGAGGVGTPHTFHYTPPAGSSPAHVSVAGSFNEWSSVADPLVRGSDGTYSADLKLPSGLLHYKLVADGKWMADPTADPSLQIDNGFGDVLSGISIAAQGATAHVIRYVPPPGSPTVPVSVAGDFNGWNAGTNPMVRAADGSYSTAVQITPGLHYYKIVYDGKWIPDPTADKSLENDDGFGGKNSGINIP